MSLRIPVSVTAAEDIKQLALRFAKSLEANTGKRIRGVKLYSAFVKPLGYDSYNEVTAASARTQASFPMKEYIVSLKRELRKHLPVEASGDDITSAIDAAADPGSVLITIDGHNAPESSIDTLTKSMFFQQFKRKVFKEGRQRCIGIKFLFDSPKRYTAKVRTSAIEVTLDYTQWPNENDPLFEWEAFDSFIRMLNYNAASDNSVDIRILRITQEKEHQSFTGFNQHNIPEWAPYIKVIDIGPAHKGLIDLLGKDARAITQDNTDSTYANVFDVKRHSFSLKTDYLHILNKDCTSIISELYFLVDKKDPKEQFWMNVSTYALSASILALQLQSRDHTYDRKDLLTLVSDFKSLQKVIDNISPSSDAGLNVGIEILKGYVKLWHDEEKGCFDYTRYRNLLLGPSTVLSKLLD